MDSASNSTVKTPEVETATPTRMPPGKTSPFRNGGMKRHAQPSSLHNLSHSHHPVVVTYKECLKNHAASLGGHAVDGCGEFMPSPNSNPAEPTSLKCAACGCHRNFHRREPDDPPPNEAPALEYHPLNRHHPPPPLPRGNSSGSPINSASPPPISSSYYPSAPHMLLALSHGLCGPPPDNTTPVPGPADPGSFGSGSRKRFRTKFTLYQKEKMLELAERIGWKMQKRDEDLINQSCSDISVDKGVFKVWMHNNKNTLGKKDPPQPENTPPLPSAATGNRTIHSGVSPGASDDTKLNAREISHYHSLQNIGGDGQAVGINCSSSSS